jgi:hypothetical protein
MCWIAKAAVKKKWSSGLQEEALLTDHNGDVPNGYARWARTPLRQRCNRIPILAIPILAIPISVILPDRDPDFSDPSRSGSRF